MELFHYLLGIGSRFYDFNFSIDRVVLSQQGKLTQHAALSLVILDVEGGRCFVDWLHSKGCERHAEKDDDKGQHKYLATPDNDIDVIEKMDFFFRLLGLASMGLISLIH